ncbi:hypothetical protein [Streptomyces camelliae]|uniref:Uncharacterized protein n=1 Tax=Streptomyces camelliae TaxID=3004093 RepID=A0ABY7NUG1_9ACTN|nr:hypothetical protein [Streptomyces sp. HUAS 2-6]WBO61881.1 hypothetical protein O1G22_03015 [Streptomyces sp. HUAS 2-6]
MPSVSDADPFAHDLPMDREPPHRALHQAGRESLVLCGKRAFNAFGPRNDLVTADAHRMAGLPAWVNVQCAREALSEDGFGAAVRAAADRGELSRTASTVGGAVAADRRG